MKKTVTTIIAVFIIAALSINAQGFKLGVTGGLNLLQSPDILTKDISEGGVGFGSGYQFGVKGKFSLPIIPLKVVGFVSYSKFSSDGSLNNQNIENEWSIVTVGFGGEWSLVPGPISPYLALDILYNRFGEKTQKNTTNNTEMKDDGVSRSGVGIGGGIDVTILPKIDLDLSARYNLNNLVGKEDGEENINSLSVTLNVFFNIL